MESAKPFPLRRWLGQLKRSPGRIAQSLRERTFRRRVRAPFKLVSYNCFGGEAYRELGRPYLTPFVGLFVPPDSFLRLCEDFDRYMQASLCFTDQPGFERPPGQREYPVGMLGGEVEIHFMHYATEDEAREKWARRTERFLAEAAAPLFMFCDSDGCERAHILRFDALPIERKVCFTAKPYPECASVVWVEDAANEPWVPNGPDLYKIVRRRFDLAGWLNGGPLRTRRGKIWSRKSA